MRLIWYIKRATTYTRSRFKVPSAQYLKKKKKLANRKLFNCTPTIICIKKLILRQLRWEAKRSMMMVAMAATIIFQILLTKHVYLHRIRVECRSKTLGAPRTTMLMKLAAESCSKYITNSNNNSKIAWQNNLHTLPRGENNT